MTNLFKIIFFLLLISPAAFSQKCNIEIKDGTKITTTAQSWANPLLYDPKFQKAKDDKKDELVVLYNADVAAGKIAPTNYPMSFTTKKTTLEDGSYEYAVSTVIAGKEYTFYSVCKDDTLFLARNRGPVEVPDGKGGIYGYSLQGIQKLPLSMKVGDRLPTYDDVIIVFPSTTDINVKKNVFSHNSSKTTNEFGFAVDSRTGQSFFGAYTKTTPIAVYRTIDVAVRQSLSSSGHIVHYVNAEVTGEQEITVNGKPYKTFIIQSETWSKSTMKASYESADEEVNRQQQKLSDKMFNKYDKMLVKKQVTNELGYMVSYSKEWFAPALGAIVKTEAYDMYGGIAGGSLLTSIE